MSSPYIEEDVIDTIRTVGVRDMITILDYYCREYKDDLTAEEIKACRIIRKIAKSLK